jgi:hypothetical protein
MRICSRSLCTDTSASLFHDNSECRLSILSCCCSLDMLRYLVSLNVTSYFLFYRKPQKKREDCAGEISTKKLTL